MLTNPCTALRAGRSPRTPQRTARAIIVAVIYMLAGGCDGSGEPTRVPPGGAPGMVRPTAVTPGAPVPAENVAVAAADEEQLILERGPAAGMYSGCWANSTDGGNLADSFTFPQGATITEVRVFACSSAVTQVGRTVHVKVLGSSGRFPGAYLYEVDAAPTVQFSGSSTSPYMVSVRLPQPFVAEAGVTYWVGVSGNGFEMTQTSILKPDDGLMAVFGGRTLRGLTDVGDMTLRLYGTAGAANRDPAAELIVATPEPREGSAVEFTLHASDPDGDALTYIATFGDGTPAESGTVTASPLTLSHVYEDNAAPGSAYQASVTIRDALGASTRVTAAVSVANAAPVVDPITDAVATAGVAHTFAATFADAGRADGPWSFSVDWGDGTPASPGIADAPGAISASHTYAARGDYTATVTVTDKDGSSGSRSATVSVKNTPPTVSLTGPAEAGEGSAVELRATGADADGDALTYAWDFDGDGSVDATTPDGVVTYHFPDNGRPRVTVTVDDGHGGTASATHEVTVSNVAPTGVLGAPEAAREGSAISLALSNLVDPSKADLAAGLLAAFSCDGEVFGPFGLDMAASCGVADNGLRTVAARVADKDGGVSTYTRTVRVENVAPAVNAGLDRVVASGETVELSGHFSDPGAADAPWSWSWSSGQSGSATSPAQRLVGTYRACGAATLTLTVSDKDGGVGTDAVTISVTPLEVAVDVKADVIGINEVSSGIVAVHVFSSGSFDAATLDPATVRLTGGAGQGTSLDRRSDGTWNWVADRDLNGDGRVDANLRFRRDDLFRNGDLALGTVHLVLTATAGGCVHVRGTDMVLVR